MSPRRAEGRPSAWLRGKKSKRQAESGGLSGLDRLRKHQEEWKDGRRAGGRKPRPMIGRVTQEGIRSDWGGRWMEEEKESCNCLEQQFGPIIKLED